MFFFSVPPEKSNQKESSLHAPVRTNPTLQNCAAGLASLKQVLTLPAATFFSPRICYLPSRYRNI